MPTGAAWQPEPGVSTAAAIGARSPSLDARRIRAIQRLAGNAAVNQLLQGGRQAEAESIEMTELRASHAQEAEASGSAGGAEAGGKAAVERLTLPPYLQNMTSAGHSTVYKLTEQDITAVTDLIRGRKAQNEAQNEAQKVEYERPDIDASVVSSPLASEPETFIGGGRTFHLRGKKRSFDVTVSITPESGAPPQPMFFPNPKRPEGTESGLSPDEEELASAHRDEGVKVDHQLAATSGHATSSHRSMTLGFKPSAAVYAPVDGLNYVGGQMGGGPASHSERDRHDGLAVSEQRTLRSAPLSVRVKRQVVYTVRIKQLTVPGDDIVKTRRGSLEMRVPEEYLVPEGTQRPVLTGEFTDGQGDRVRQAVSLSTIGVEDSGDPHVGGGGLADTVAGAVKSSLVAPGTEGREQLYAQVSLETIQRQMPRLLAGWVTSDVLQSAEDHKESRGVFRMRADIVQMQPLRGPLPDDRTVGGGPDQARHHQVDVTTESHSAATGASLSAEGGVAHIIGVPGAAELRSKAVAGLGAKEMGFSSLEETTTVRQGAEVRGDKVLFLSKVRLTVQYIGPHEHLRLEKHRATHDLNAWMSLRKEEAYELFPDRLPEDDSVRPLYDRRKRSADGTVLKDADGKDQLHDRYLQFDALGNSTSLTHLDTRPLIEYLEEKFEMPELAHYLPRLGKEKPFDHELSDKEHDRRLDNLRRLHDALSPARLAVHKNRLLTSGVLIRLRSKSRMESRDAEVRVRATTGQITYLGDTEDWLIRNNAGSGWSAQTGKRTSRQAGARWESWVTPGKNVGAKATLGATWNSKRGARGGPVGRTDSLNAGSTTASTFETELKFDIMVTKTTRDRTLKRSVTPGRPGRDTPTPEIIELGDFGEAAKVRLSTPTELTVDSPEEKAQAPQATKKFRRAPSGIPALSTMADLAGGVRTWEYVESVGKGEHLTDLALSLLADAAPKDWNGKNDKAFEVPALAPKMAIDDHFSPEDIRSELREGTHAYRTLTGLRYPRRYRTLEGAVGDRFRLTLASKEPLKEVVGVGIENMALGGHQAAGERSSTRTMNGSLGATGTAQGDDFRLRAAAAVTREVGRTTGKSVTTGATVERNAVLPRTHESLFLVECDLTVTMVVEVKAGHGSTPVVLAGDLKLPRQVALWLTEEQLKDAGLQTGLAEWRKKKQEEKEKKEAEALAKHRTYLEQKNRRETEEKTKKHHAEWDSKEAREQRLDKSRLANARRKVEAAETEHTEAELRRTAEQDQDEQDFQHWSAERQAQEAKRESELNGRAESLRNELRTLNHQYPDGTEPGFSQQRREALTAELRELERLQREREERARRREARLAKNRTRTDKPRTRPAGKARKRRARLEQERAGQADVRRSLDAVDADQAAANNRREQLQREIDQADRELSELKRESQVRREQKERERRARAQKREARRASELERMKALEAEERKQQEIVQAERERRAGKRARELQAIKQRKNAELAAFEAAQEQRENKKEKERQDKEAAEKEWADTRSERQKQVDSSPAASGSGAPPIATTLAEKLPLGFGLIDSLPDFLPLRDLLREDLKAKHASLAADLLPDTETKDKHKNTQALTKLLGQDGAMGVLASAMDGGAVLQLKRNTHTPLQRGDVYWAELHVVRTGAGTVKKIAPNDREIEYATAGFRQVTTGTTRSKSAGVQAQPSGFGETGNGTIPYSGAASGLGFDSSHARQKSTTAREQVGVRAIMGDPRAFLSTVQVPVEVKLVLRSGDRVMAETKQDGMIEYRALQKDLNALAKVKDTSGGSPARSSGADAPRQTEKKDLRSWRQEGVALPWASVVNGFTGTQEVVATVRDAVKQAMGKTSDVLGGTNEAHYQLREAVSTEWMITWLPYLVSTGVDLPPIHLSGLEGADADCALHGKLRDCVLLGESETMTFEQVAQSLLTDKPVLAEGGTGEAASTVQAPRAAGNTQSGSTAHFRSGGPSFGTERVRNGSSGLNASPFTTGMPGGAVGKASNTSGMVPLQKPKDETVLVQFTLDVRAIARLRRRHTQRIRGEEAVGDFERTLTNPVVVRLHKQDVEKLLKNGGLGRFRDLRVPAPEAAGQGAKQQGAPATASA